MPYRILIALLMMCALKAYPQATFPTMNANGVTTPAMAGMGSPVSIISCGQNSANFLFVQVDATNGRLWLCDTAADPSHVAYAWDHLSTTSFYTSGGAVTGVKCFVGTVVSTATTGAWTINYSAMALTTVLTVQPTALSTSNTYNTSNMASLTSVTTTAASGYVMTGNILSVLGVSSTVPQATSTTVYLEVCGT